MTTLFGAHAYPTRRSQESYGLAGTDRDDVSPADSLKSPAAHSTSSALHEGKNVSR
jgi:hypothetical protein